MKKTKPKSIKSPKGGRYTDQPAIMAADRPGPQPPFVTRKSGRKK